VEVKGGNPKFSWEVVGVYRSPNEDMRVIERFADRTGFSGNSTKCSIIGGDLNLPYADWNENADGNSGAQALINSLVWGNGYSQVINSPTRGEALLDVYLVRPGSSDTSSGTVQGVSDHLAVILEVEWEDTYTEPQVGRVVPVYNKTDGAGLQIFLRDKFTFWASNYRNVEEIWNNFKNTVDESIEVLCLAKHLENIRTPNTTTRKLND
jgi:hypothetical protein